MVLIEINLQGHPETHQAFISVDGVISYFRAWNLHPHLQFDLFINSRYYSWPASIEEHFFLDQLENHIRYCVEIDEVFYESS